MPRKTDAKYREVRGLSRGLEVLRTMNSGSAQALSIAEISSRAGLHRTTVRRILETLASNGYVRRSASDDTFRLALRVRELSEGFTDDEWIAEAAPPILGDLLRRAIWPSDLCIPDGDALVVRESTHRFSPLSFHRSVVGIRLPMLFSAAGRAYFAFCPDAEREQILALLQTRGDEPSRLVAKSPKMIAALIKATRDSGFGTNNQEWAAQDAKIAAIALPISYDDRVYGALNIVFLASAISVSEAALRYLGDLRAAVERIEHALRESQWLKKGVPG